MIEVTFINDIGLYLARFICGSTALLASVWLLERWQWIKNYQMRAWLWKLALLCTLVFLLPVSISLDSQKAISLPIVKDQTSVRNINASHTSEINQVAQESPPSSVTLENQNPNFTVNNIPGAAAESFNATPVENISLINAFIIVWLLISAGFCFRLAMGYFLGVRSMGKREAIGLNEEIYQVFNELCSNAKLEHTPILSKGSHIASPVTLLNHEICLPIWADQNLSPTELRSLLAHEIGHVKNNDLRFLLFTQLLCCFVFFQPLVFIARNRLIDLSEFLADQWSLQECQDSQTVANVLLDCASKVKHHSPVQWNYAMSGKASRLRIRIEEILQSNGQGIAHLGRVRKTLAVLAVIGAALVIPKFEYSYADPSNEIQTNTQTISQEDVLEENKTDEDKLFEKMREESSGEMTIAQSDGNKSESSFNFSFDSGFDVDSYTHSNGRSRIINSQNGLREEILWRGEVSVDDTESRITQLEPDGYWEYSSSGVEPDRSIRFKPKSNGSLEIDYRVDGKQKAFTDDDQAWFNTVLVHFFRRTGINAEQRVARLLRRGGIDAVVNELPHIKPDSGFRRYITTLIDSESLNDGQFTRMVEATSTVSSDSELSKIIKYIVDHEIVSGDRWDTLLHSALTISSDSQMSSILLRLSEKNKHFHEKQWEKFLLAANSISSDSNARGLLENICCDTNILTEKPYGFFKLASGISSDSHTAKLLKKVVENSNILASEPEPFFHVANTISSDSELSRLLGNKTLLQQLNRPGWELFFTATETISSDSAMSRLFIEAIEHGKLSTDNWTSLLKLTDREISSSSAKGKVLKQINKNLPDESGLQNLYKQVVNNISSKSVREQLSQL